MANLASLEPKRREQLGIEILRAPIFWRDHISPIYWTYERWLRTREIRSFRGITLGRTRNIRVGEPKVTMNTFGLDRM